MVYTDVGAQGLKFSLSLAAISLAAPFMKCPLCLTPSSHG